MQGRLRQGRRGELLRRRRQRTFLPAVAVAALAVLPGSAHAATITPTTFADQYNTGAECSLREATVAANTDAAFGGCPPGSGADTIPLAGGTYLLTIAGPAVENASASGDLDLLTDMTISHTGLTPAVIDAGGIDRIFHAFGGTVVLNISGLTLRNGIAAGGQEGGAMFSGAILTMSNVTVSGSTGGNGGGISFASGSATLTNVTFSGNRAPGNGGGFVTGPNLVTTFRNVTVTNNTADSDGSGSGNGGGVSVLAGGMNLSPNLSNTLVAGNSDTGGEAPDCGGIVGSLGNNLIGTTTGCTFGAVGGDKTNVANPLLGPLADNGGSTLTHALLPGSPAIDGGGPGAASTDQRGVPRSSDIGAYEFAICGKAIVNRVGTTGKDKLKGTTGADGILGLNGKDTLLGLAGKDGLCGGGGPDTLKGGGGKDRLIGQKGKDRMFGGKGNDSCKGGSGKDKEKSC